MFVFVKHDHTLHLTVFGPATPDECRAWMRMKKLHPSKAILSERILPSGSTDCSSSGFEDDDTGLLSPDMHA